MPSPATPSILISPDTCHHHCSCDRPNPVCTGCYVGNLAPSPTHTAVTMWPHNSPTFAISPLPVAAQIPTLAVLNTQNTYHHHRSPSPVHATLVFTPNVNPLVALDLDSSHHKLHYDVSKDPSHAYVSKSRGPRIPITNDQRRSLVVEGTPHSAFHVVFGDPVLTSTIEFRGSLTIGDFLDELCSYMHKRVGRGEMSNLEKDTDRCSAAAIARTRRCGATSDPHGEWERGMKRVDMLGKGCKFYGIRLDTSCTSNYHTLFVEFGK